MKQLDLRDVSPIILNKMSHNGIFLTVRDSSGRVNTMNIGWGSISWYWNRPVFIAPVRHARFTYEMLKTAKDFTISVPLDDSMNHALSFVGTHHGNEVDKFTVCNLSAVPAQKVDGVIIGDCALHLECRIQLVTEMDLSQMSEEIHSGSYPDDDLHTLYFGEVVACYRSDL